MADARRGRRPEFTAAAPASQAEGLFEVFLKALAESGCPDVAAGVFGANMQVESVAEGPLNVIVEIPARGDPPPR
jgi:D-tyrosyl-tRNA(Tyr) deacylase